MCVNDDLQPFRWASFLILCISKCFADRCGRPMPKFLCVKGILFFSFWQGLFISVLVAGGAIKKLGPYTDSEHISLGLIDTLICIEMPFFAVAHMYAFATRDYVDPNTSYVARLPVFHAFKDAFGLRDVVEDVKTTLHGEGMDYREFEPSEGQIHQGAGRDRRIRAGLRYSQGGKRKYWLPQPATSSSTRPGVRIPGRSSFDEVHAPLLAHQQADAVQSAADLRSPDEGFGLFTSDAIAEEGYDLPFGELDDMDEELFEHSKKYLFGAYNYPCVDVSSETARKTMWVAEERILRHEHSAWFSPLNGPPRPPRSGGYGATENAEQSHQDFGGKAKLVVRALAYQKSSSTRRQSGCLPQDDKVACSSGGRAQNQRLRHLLERLRLYARRPSSGRKEHCRERAPHRRSLGPVRPRGTARRLVPRLRCVQTPRDPSCLQMPWTW